MGTTELQEHLDDVRSRYGVVGATLGVLRCGAMDVAASGLLNLNTRVECTPDSVFQIGSISKVFTATLLMQLVDEGRVKLCDPVIKYLPDFVLADASATRTVTVRQLLNHTSGIEGDFFPADDPEGPSTASYIRKMRSLRSIYQPGKGPVSYSNSSYVVAGRIIEVLTDMAWQDAVMKRICEPLNMPAAFAYPREALRFRCAMGHTPEPEHPNRLVVAPVTFIPISMAAAGTVLTMSAESLLLFAKAHMGDGAYNGRHLLREDSARNMREDVVALPPFTLPGVTHWGIGWFLGRGANYRMVGHNGGTQGQYAYLRMFPEKGVAFTVLTNSSSAKMFQELEKHLMESLLGISVAPDPPAESFEVQAERYVGHYRNAGRRFTVTHEGGKLRVSIAWDYAAVLGTPAEVRGILEPYRRDVFMLRDTNGLADELKIVFTDSDENNHAVYLRDGGRMAVAESV